MTSPAASLFTVLGLSVILLAARHDTPAATSVLATLPEIVPAQTSESRYLPLPSIPLLVRLPLPCNPPPQIPLLLGTRGCNREQTDKLTQDETAL